MEKKTSDYYFKESEEFFQGLVNSELEKEMIEDHENPNWVSQK